MDDSDQVFCNKNNFSKFENLVPLTQTFVGVSEPNSGLIKAYMDEACYDKCIDFVREEHQVLIFVHSRGATIQLAEFLLQRASMENDIESFLPLNITKPEYVQALKRAKTMRNRDIQNLIEKGIGIHHAGLVRQDRLQMEKLFADSHIKVLVCTATLAWGVNLPAHAVIIRVWLVFKTSKLVIFRELMFLIQTRVHLLTWAF